jgi:dihydrofolate reductase
VQKIVAAINMTIDGFCDHTSVDPDEEIHKHYEDLLNSAGTALYGRITYQLMQYWQYLVKNPSDDKAMDDFATAMDKIPKIVFSHTLKDLGWESARLANDSPENVVAELKQSGDSGKDVLVGSRSLIIRLMQMNLIDELQLCIHPVVAGSGLPLFENIADRTRLKLVNTKTFNSGAVILYYEPVTK